ncbi:MAG: hypothetical protein EOO24_15010 [Comamonadaceae bacterium]|nr:MAG: hypothetical protein EOO24_15010 [Comamonadaceae bacterium]
MPKDTPQGPREGREPAPRTTRTPDTDLQPEDTGTAASQPSTGGTPAQAAMKQQSKTEHESGSGGKR